MDTCLAVGRLVHFGALLVGGVRIGDGNDELTVGQQVAVEHRLHRGRAAADHVHARDRLGRTGGADHLDAAAGFLALGGDEIVAVLPVRAEHHDALEIAHRGDGVERRGRLLAGTEDAERPDVRGRDVIDGERRGRADAHARQLELVHQRERLGRLDVEQDDDAPVERARVLVEAPVVGGRRRLDDLRACAHAGEPCRRHRAHVNVGEIAALRVGMTGLVAGARQVDRVAGGEIAERGFHRLDAIGHRKMPCHVVVGDDDSHVEVGPSLVRRLLAGALSGTGHDGSAAE